MGMVSLEQLPQSELEGLPTDVQSQLRAIRGLRDASQRMGLGLLAFEDAREFVAMLRENVAQQKERIVEAANYERTYPSRGTAASTIDVAWRHGYEILPLHAAQKRLAFAKLLLPRLATAPCSQSRVEEEIDIDIAYCVAKLVICPMKHRVDQKNSVYNLSPACKVLFCLL
jgi:hypothetical protein